MELLLTGMISMLGATLYRDIRYLRNTRETNRSCQSPTGSGLDTTLIQIQHLYLHSSMHLSKPIWSFCKRKCQQVKGNRRMIGVCMGCQLRRVRLTESKTCTVAYMLLRTQNTDVSKDCKHVCNMFDSSGIVCLHFMSHRRADRSARTEPLLQIVCKTHESNVSTEHHDHQG